MASPVGHYLLGLTVTQALARNERERKQGVILAAVATLPDLDVIAGLLSGYLWRYHHGMSHSLGMGAILAIAVLAVLLWRKSDRPYYLALSVFLVYDSHVVLDYTSLDTSRFPGVPLLWPLLSERFVSPWTLLPYTLTIGPVISIHNIVIVMRELFLFIPLVALVHTLRTRRPPWPRPAMWIYGGLFMVAVWASIFMM